MGDMREVTSPPLSSHGCARFLSSGLAPLDQGDAMEKVEFVEQVMDDSMEGCVVYCGIWITSHQGQLTPMLIQKIYGLLYWYVASTLQCEDDDVPVHDDDDDDDVPVHDDGDDDDGCFQF